MALRMNAALLSVALALLSSRADAFSTPASAFVARSRSASAAAGPLHMSDKEKKEVTFDTNSQKELTYDEKSGRFFETGDSIECIPEDEYCAVDKETGEMIRLTVEEKERIFLDALQVRSWQAHRHIMCTVCFVLIFDPAYFADNDPFRFDAAIICSNNVYYSSLYIIIP